MNSQNPDPAVRSSYQTRKRAKVVLAAPVMMTAVFAWLGFYFTQLPGSVPVLETVLITAFFVGCLVSTWYSMLFGVWRLELTADTLRWRSILQSGEVPLTELRRMRPGYLGSRAEVIEFARHRPIRVLVRDGLPQFAADVRQAAPHLEVSFAEPSGYRRST